MNLTPRQTEVLRLVAGDVPRKEIAVQLGLSQNTVDYHVKKITTRLNVPGMFSAVRLAVRSGLLACFVVMASAQPSPLEPIVSPPQQTVSLAWDRAPDASVTGYWVYYGPASRAYTNSVNVGNVTNATLRVPVGADYFAATAYDANGSESDKSSEAHYAPIAWPVVNITPLTWLVSWTANNRTNEVQAKTSIGGAWQTVATAPPGVNAVTQLNQAGAFYRVKVLP